MEEDLSGLGPSPPALVGVKGTRRDLLSSWAGNTTERYLSHVEVVLAQYVAPEDLKPAVPTW